MISKRILADKRVRVGESARVGMNPIKPDLVLIYRKPDDAVLQLVRLGSHSELSL